MPDFTNKVLDWFQKYGRHNLPWQQDKTPYRIWISEIMLQQTQVNTVIPYFERFIEYFPTVSDLADSELDEVLHLWSGLGYYSRARNLYKAAKMVVKDYRGVFPTGLDDLMRLPGIGRSTAGAVLSISQNQPQAILDGNVKRVLCRYHGVEGWPGDGAVERHLWCLADQHTPNDQAAAYAQAIMDLGATVCIRSKPRCDSCPVTQSCLARRHDIQGELPQRKAKKVLPTREILFAIMENKAGAIFLQKRPPVGIWGGLWSFPECSIDTNIQDWVKNTFGYNVESVQYNPVFRHTFSHFRLDITPVRMKLYSEDKQIRESADVIWLNPGERKRTLGMAAPVVKLIEELKASSEKLNDTNGTMCEA